MGTPAAAQAPPSAEFVKFSCDILQRALREAANLLTKGMTFCLAITAALVGYVISQKLQGPLPQFVLAAGIVTVVLFSILASHWISALLATEKCLEQLVASFSPDDFNNSPMPVAFQQFRSVGRTFKICALLEISVLIGGMALLLFS